MIEGQGAANRDIIYAIKKIAGADGIKKAQLVMGTVKSKPNERDKTCDVDITLGDACQSISGVHLNASSNDGFTQFPTVESDILIALMPDNSAYMIACEDIDKVACYIDENNYFEFDKNGFIWNEGNNGGIVKVIELTQKVNNLENLVNNLLNTLKSTTIPLAPSGTYPFAPLYAAFNALTPTQQNEIEDTKIKH